MKGVKMDEVATCISCNRTTAWVIYDHKIKCCVCGKEYTFTSDMSAADLVALVNLAPDGDPRYEPPRKLLYSCRKAYNSKCTSKKIKDFLKQANSDLGNPKYKPTDLIEDYSRAVIIGQLLIDEVERLSNIVHEASEDDTESCYSLIAEAAKTLIY